VTGLASRYDLVIFDLDGVVYVGTEPIKGAAAAIEAVRAAGVPVEYATNNASRRADEVAALLTSLGVPARPEEVTTSAMATAALLARQLPRGAPVLVVGAQALRAEVADAGLCPVDGADGHPLAVAQGYGPEVGWAQLAEACVAVRAGARWVVTNADRTLPSPRGPLPGNGSLVAAVATALGRGPDEVVGKPAPELFAAAAARHGARRPLVVGDRLDTDVEGAVRAGMDSLLVLTGVTRPAELLAAQPEHRPTHIAADLSGLSAEDVPGQWSVTADGDRLALAGDGDAAAALREIAAAAWASGLTAVVPRGPAAERALAELGLT
jgi:glycerol 3-phosphatase-2